MPPNIDGVEIKVVWSDGHVDAKLDGDLRALGFAPSPDYCDAPGTPGGSPDCGHFFLSYRGLGGTSLTSEELEIPGVIWLESFSASKKDKLYSDEQPNFSDIKLTLKYIYDEDDPYANPDGKTVGTDNIVTAEKTRNMTLVYPPFDFTTNGSEPPTVKAYIGKTMGAANQKDAEIEVADYYQVSGVKWVSQAGDFFFFDDETWYADNTAANIKESGKTAREFLFDFVTAAKPSFRINYTTPDGKKSDTKTIDWDAYKANVQYAYDKNGITLDPIDIILGADGTTTDTSLSGDTWVQSGDRISILGYDEDNDNKWTFWMRYVPKEYVDDDKAYLDMHAVDVPVYTFAGKISLARNLPGFADNVTVKVNDHSIVPNSATALITDMWEDFEKALNDAWVLTAYYNYKKEPQKTQTIGLTSSMFYYGYNSGGTAINLDSEGTLSNLFTASPGTASSVIKSKDYSLPVHYRGETDDDTVKIDVTYQY